MCFKLCTMLLITALLAYCAIVQLGLIHLSRSQRCLVPPGAFERLSQLPAGDSSCNNPNPKHADAADWLQLGAHLHS